MVMTPEFTGLNLPLPVALLCVFGVTLVLSLLAVPLVARIAMKLGMIDAPGGRKQHDAPAAPVGGIAIFSVLLLVFLGGGSLFGINLPWALITSLALILLVGVIDDIREVDARLKFAVHFLVAGILVVGGGARIAGLGDLLGLGPIWLGWLSVPFSIACVVYIINAVNMMDGLDGLAGGNALIIFLWFGMAAWLGEEWKTVFEIAVFCACLTGFLFFNARTPWRKQASVFLGDAGCTGIAVMIAWFAITMSQGHEIGDFRMIHPAAVAWIIALPIIDAFGLLVARIKDKKPPFAPDRRHFHHHFIHAGFGVGVSVYTILLWSAALGAFGFLGQRYEIPIYVLGWLWVFLWLGHTALTVRADLFIRLLSFLKRRA